MICIIPARSGSKRLKKKNILKFANKPLIFHTIESALKSKYIDKVVLSTDSPEIASICETLDVLIPFYRPDNLANDSATTVDTVIYTLDRLINEYKYEISNFILLQPTSPLRNEIDINNAIEIFNNNNVNSVVSVTKSKLSLNSILLISEDGALIRGTNATSTMNSNEHYYYPNGAIYIYNYYQYKKYRKTIIDKTLPYIMDNNRSIDIDTISDFEFANYLFNKQLNE